MINSQKDLWSKVNKRCESLGLTCNYDLDVCLNPKPVLAGKAELVDSDKIKLSWEKNPENDTRMDKDKLKYEVSTLTTTVGADNTTTRAWKTHFSGTDATSSTELLRVDPTAGQNIEYYITVNAECKEPRSTPTATSEDKVWTDFIATKTEDLTFNHCSSSTSDLDVAVTAVIDSANKVTLSWDGAAAPAGVEFWAETFVVSNACSTGVSNDVSGNTEVAGCADTPAVGERRKAEDNKVASVSTIGRAKMDASSKTFAAEIENLESELTRVATAEVNTNAVVNNQLVWSRIKAKTTNCDNTGDSDYNIPESYKLFYKCSSAALNKFVELDLVGMYTLDWKNIISAEP